jgi:hypothetical protein
MVGVFCELVEDGLEDTAEIPSSEAGMHGLPRPETVRQVPPLHAGLGDEEDRVHEDAVLQDRRPSLAPRFCRQEVLDPAPVDLAQLVSVHRKLRSSFRSRRKLFRP